MAYSGTTSTAPNVPALVTQGLAYASTNVTGTAEFQTGVPRTWIYSSSHLNAGVTAVNFFGADAVRLGFKVGDMVMSYGTSNVTMHKITVVGTTTSQLSTGVVVGNA
jgi:hypothetical protein